MVDFTSIRVHGNYIYAKAYDLMHKKRYKVLIHKKKEMCIIKPSEYDLDVLKAAWSLQGKLRRKKKLSKNVTIAWY